MSIAVSVEGVSKVYRLGMITSATLSEDFSRWWARIRGRPDPFRKIGHEHHERLEGKEFWALDEVSFEVSEGEVLGVIGRNGAGKSTLFKVLSQVTAPTSGRIRLRGRVASLLEVGTGFHPELTGRENVFLNGAILGMTKAEIRRKFDEIVAFSECEAFIDTPVKRYSSGMYVRLAFAVAAHLESEILIVDEVLAVGDAQFQQKCLGKMRHISTAGRTVLFVSHSMASVAALCTKALLLRDGRIAGHGQVRDVVADYRSDQVTSPAAGHTIERIPRMGSGKARFSSLQIQAVTSDGRHVDVGYPGCNVLVEAHVKCLADFDEANVAVVLHDESGLRVIDAYSAVRGEFLSMKAGERATVRFQLWNVLLKPGVYFVGLWLGRRFTSDAIDWIESAGAWEVQEDPAQVRNHKTFPGVYQCSYTHEVLVHPEHEVSTQLQSTSDVQPASEGGSAGRAGIR